MPSMLFTSKRKQEIYNYFQKIAGDYLQYRKRFEYYENDIIQYLNFFLHTDNSVIEIGCGCGRTIANLKGKTRVGIDVSPNMIEIAKKSYNDVEFHVMDADDMRLHQKFDVIILNNVIGYLDNVQEVFLSILSLSHDQTRIIIVSYNHLWEPILKFCEKIGLKRKSPLQNWINIHDINNLLYIAGIETYRTSNRQLLPIYIPFLSWLLNNYIAKFPFVKSACLNQYVFARPQLNYSKADLEKKFSVSICIPARNESGNIEQIIQRIPKFSRHQEIVFVEGHSEDDTWKKIQEVQKKYDGILDIKIVQQDGIGKGDAIKKAFEIANEDILMILDADMTVAPEELSLFYDVITSGKGEFINGSRLVYPMEKQAMRYLNYIGNKFFSILFTWLLEQPIKDTLCGTKVLFRSDYIKMQADKEFFGNFDPFGDFNLLFGAYKLNLKIIDLPIRYKERTYGKTNISRFSNGWMLLKMCWFMSRKIKFR